MLRPTTQLVNQQLREEIATAQLTWAAGGEVAPNQSLETMQPAGVLVHAGDAAGLIQLQTGSLRKDVHQMDKSNQANKNVDFCCKQTWWLLMTSATALYRETTCVKLLS